MFCWSFLRRMGCLAAFASAPLGWTQTAAPRNLDWCEVAGNAADFDGKQIEVRATYRTRFETSEMYCLGCKAGGTAWVDSHNAAPFPAPLHGMHTGTANVIFAGRFHSAGGPFGHLGQYEFRFDVTAVKKAVKIEPSGLPADALPPELATKVCGGMSATNTSKGAARN